jgi:hypothetical protein
MFALMPPGAALNQSDNTTAQNLKALSHGRAPAAVRHASNLSIIPAPAKLVP